MNAAEAAGESSTAVPGQMSDRTARLVLLVVACLAMWGIVAVLPETAYVVVGILSTLGWQRARAWRAGRHETPAEDTTEDEPRPDVAAALHRLVGDDRGVLLTRLRDDLGAADTKTVRALLDEAGIPVRAGVRTRAGNGPGVHTDDIPASPPAHGECCCCRSDANANSNNEEREGPGEGIDVRRTNGGLIIYDLADHQRRRGVVGH